MMEESVVEDLPPPQDTFDRDLVARLQECLHARKKNVLCNRAVAAVDWEKVAFAGHSAEECRQRWVGIQSRLRLYRTLGELLDDAQASRWDQQRSRKALKVKRHAEGAPTRPLSAFLIFCQKRRPKIFKKHPDLSAPEVMTLLAKRYAELAPEKKQTFRAQAADLRTEYNTAMKEFERQHPELEIAHPPKKPPSARSLYLRKHADLPRAEAITAYRALSTEEKARFTRKAQRAQQRYFMEVEAYKNMHPGWEMPSTALRSQKPEGVTRRPRHAYNIFMKEKMPTVSAMPISERMKHCAGLWRSMDAESRLPYQQQADQENEKYEEYVKSLPEEERAKLSVKKTPRKKADRTDKPAKKKKKRVKRITARELFLREKMPTDFDALTEKEWHRILTRKFTKLGWQDKEAYEQRAAEVTAAAAAAAESDEEPAEDAASDGPETGEEEEEEEEETMPVVNGYSAAVQRQNHGDSDIDIKPPPTDPLELSASEAEEEQGEEEGEEEDGDDKLPPAGGAPVGSFQANEMVRVHGSPDQLLARPRSLSSAFDGPTESSAATDDDALSPPRRGKKRAKPPSGSASSDEGRKASHKNKSKERLPEEQNGQDEISSPYEWFVQNFRVKSMDGLSPKKMQKKAKKAWNSLSDDERRRVERRYAKSTGRL